MNRPATLTLGICAALLVLPSRAQENPLQAFLREQPGFVPLRAGLRLDPGALVAPSLEEYGQIGAATVVESLRLAVKETTFDSQFELGTLSRLGSDDPAFRRVSEICPNSATVRVTQIVRRDLTSAPMSAAERRAARARLIQELAVNEDDLLSYVIVGGVISARFSLQGCDTAAANEVARQLDELAWAYRPTDTVETRGASGTQLILRLLQLFEVKEFEARTLTLSSIDSAPSGGIVAWADRLRLGRFTPSDAPAERFVSLGPGPVRNRKLWPGTFFFRIEQGGSTYLVSRDLTLADHNQDLILTVQ